VTLKISKLYDACHLLNHFIGPKNEGSYFKFDENWHND